MNQLDHLWRRWLVITFGFTMLIGFVSIGFISYRTTSSAQESRAILRQLLYTHLDRESPRIADELYLRLESLEQRERMLKDLLGDYGAVSLKFERQDEGGSKGVPPGQGTWTEQPGLSTLVLPVKFGDLFIGNLDTQVRWSSTWMLPSFKANLLITAALIFVIIGIWAAIYAVAKEKVLVPAMEEFRERSAKEAFSKVATQVAHDIRSPLAALEIISSHLDELPESSRLLLRHAIGRIRDIANNLLERRDRATLAPGRTSQSQSVESLPVLMESMISEKREQYRSKPGIEIEAKSSPSDHRLFIRVQPIEFARVLSNLIDNAVEAMDGVGRVVVRLEASDAESVRIEIMDTGRGIAPEILPRLMRRGVTFGKPGGSGLGLAHAKDCIEAWGGRVSLASQVGVGTTVTFSLPLAEAPVWFTDTLEQNEGGLVVVLDDDPSIHEIWKRRIVPGSLRLVHFFSSKDLGDWVDANPAESALALFLVDDHLGEAGSGFDLVLAKKLEDRTVMVTSRADEGEIRQRCQAHGVRMIPKGMAAAVGIRVVLHGLRTGLTGGVSTEEGATL